MNVKATERAFWFSVSLLLDVHWPNKKNQSLNHVWLQGVFGTGKRTVRADAHKYYINKKHKSHIKKNMVEKLFVVSSQQLKIFGCTRKHIKTWSMWKKLTYLFLYQALSKRQMVPYKYCNVFCYKTKFPFPHFESLLQSGPNRGQLFTRAGAVAVVGTGVPNFSSFLVQNSPCLN